MQDTTACCEVMRITLPAAGAHGAGRQRHRAGAAARSCRSSWTTPPASSARSAPQCVNLPSRTPRQPRLAPLARPGLAVCAPRSSPPDPVPDSGSVVIRHPLRSQHERPVRPREGQVQRPRAPPPSPETPRQPENRRPGAGNPTDRPAAHDRTSGASGSSAPARSVVTVVVVGVRQHPSLDGGGPRLDMSCTTSKLC